MPAAAASSSTDEGHCGQLRRRTIEAVHGAARVRRLIVLTPAPVGRPGAEASRLQRLVRGSLGRARTLGHHDAGHRVEIAATAVRARQPAAAQAQAPPALRPRRHLERDRPVGRVDLHLAAEHRLPRPERQVHLEIVADHAIARMRNRAARAGRGRPAVRR